MSKFPLFNLGFRPFFLGAAVFAVMAGTAWIALYVFGWRYQPYGLPASIWHAHEMIYGYCLAVIAGFLLTAIRNWTGIQTLNGFPLCLLFLLWASARILPLLNNSISVTAMAAADILFAVFLILSAAYPILAVKLWRNMGIVVILLLILAGNTLFYLGLLGIVANGVHLGLYVGLYLVLTLIFIMARRVMPMFIQNGVGYPVQLKTRDWLDKLTLGLFVLFWMTELIAANHAMATGLAILLFLFHSIRLYDWYTPGIWKKPLLWVLFLAYTAMIAAFAIRSAAWFFNLSPFLAIHAFTAGGIGMITVGMMARVALGHTGRNVFNPPRILLWIFTALFLGAVFRVVPPLLTSLYYPLWISLSQMLWIVSFSMFIYTYFSMLISARPDGKPG